MKKVFTLLAALLLMSGLSWAQITWNAADQGYENAQLIEDVDFDDYVSASFSAGTNSNAPKYYNTGGAIRCYGGNYFTVSTNSLLTEIVLGFGSGDPNNNEITTDCGTYEDGTWTGSANEVTFTIGGSSGHRRIATFTITYSSSGTPDPTIAANDVTIEYNATSGTITYTINNPVSGSTFSAATESEWLTLGTVGATVPFTCTTNTAGGARTATVTLTYTFNSNQTATKNVTVTQNGNPNAIDNISDITAAGTYSVQGTIVAKSQRGFIVGDGTGYVYYYNQNYTQTDYNIGDKVKLSGSVVVYGGVYEFNNSTTITPVTSSNYVTENPTVLTGEQMDARVASTTPAELSTYVQYEGTLSVNGTHYNITDIVGATTAQGSISYPLDAEEITALDGKYVKVTGYFVGISSSTYYNTMLGSIVETTSSNPSITAENVDINYDATSGTIAYTINNPVSGGALTAATDSEWLTIGTVGSTVPFTCTANTIASPRTATVTLTYTYNTNQIVTKNVTVTQAGNPSIIDNISDITAAGTYTVQGTIVAKSQRGFIVGDGTGYVYYYNQNYTQADYNIGDKVKLSGAVAVFGGVFEFNNTTTITSATTSNYVAENPTVLTGEQMDARVASTTPAELSSFVQYEGTLSVNGTHYNITDIVGATTAQGSISYPLDAEEITALDGKHVKVTGYFVGISSSTYYNTMLGSIEEMTEPSISIANASVNAPASGAEGTLTVTYINFTGIAPSVYFCDATGAAASYNWISATLDNENNVEYVIDANNGEARTAYLMVTGGGVYSNLVTFDQAEYIAPGNWVLTDLADLTENDVFVIVCTRTDETYGGNYAMPNNNGTSAPGAISVTVVEGTLAGEPADTLQWNLELTEDGYVFYPNGNMEQWLYCTNTNNGVKVGTGDAKHFTIDDEYGYLTTVETEEQRYIGVYQAQDWRCYKLGSDGSFPANIANQTFAFYKKTTATTVTQTVALSAGTNYFSANVEITLEDLKDALVAALPSTAITIKGQQGTARILVNGNMVGQLNATNFDPALLYQIVVPSAIEITLEGDPMDPAAHPITIPAKGSVWIAFPFSEPMTPGDAFAGFAFNGDIVKGQGGSSRCTNANSNTWVGQLRTLTPGQGYIYTSNKTEDRTLIFPTNAK